MKPLVAVLYGLSFGAIGFLCAWVAITQCMRGELPSAAVAVGGMAFCWGLVIPLFKIVPGRVRPRIHTDNDGTTFRPDLGLDIPIQVALGGGVIASVLLLALLPAGQLTIPVPPSMRYSLPFTAAVVAVLGTPMLWRNIKRGSSRYVRLDEKGFEVAQGWSRRCGEWTALIDVAAAAPRQQAPTRGTIAFVLSDDDACTVAAGSITPDGTALRELARFYWQHPEARDELTDGRAAQRLRDRLGAV